MGSVAEQSNAASKLRSEVETSRDESNAPAGASAASDASDVIGETGKSPGKLRDEVETLRAERWGCPLARDVDAASASDSLTTDSAPTPDPSPLPPNTDDPSKSILAAMSPPPTKVTHPILPTCTKK